ncbi:VCBS domain-containing protein [Novosphingobium percolationis]|uniref:VCBS domain-containing protein n=1 Tax=Novosphingobium percolationis TaxID=2871811 RepID=UPI001CD6F443|nr:VCBS domain-containing protein [Novosphingobium percolationis]
MASTTKITSPAKTTVKVAMLTGGAGDDSFSGANSAYNWLNEDAALNGNLNVLANDPGSAKIYSLSATALSGTSAASQLASNVVANTTGTGYVEFPISINGATAMGRVSANADGTLHVDLQHLRAQLQTLGVSESATASFYYVVQMANGALSEAKVSITIEGENDGPKLVSADQTGRVEEDGQQTATGQVVASDVDHGDHLTYSIAETQGHYGAIAIDAETGVWTYTLANDSAAVQDLAEGEQKTDTFTVTVSDGNGGTITQTVTVTVTGDNDGPTGSATAELGNGTEDTSYTITAADLLQGFSDRDSDGALHVEDVQVSHATVHDNGDGTYTVNFDANYNGPAEVTYKVVDNHDASVPASLSLSVGAVADLSVADSSASGNEDTDITGDVGAGTTSGGSLDYVVATGPANGSVVVHGDGTYTYTPDANYHGADSFTVTVTDAAAGEEKTVTIDLAVASVADLAVADSSASGNEDTDITGDVGGSTTSGGALGYALQTGPAHGTLTLGANGGYTYTPDANYNGSDSFQVTVSDGAAGESSTVSVNLTVNAVNDPATIGGQTSGTVVEAGSANSGGTPTATGSLTASDVDNAANTFQAVATATASASGYGTFTMTAGGAWTYSLDNNNADVAALNDGQSLNDSFTVRSEDGTAQVISIHIDGANDTVVPATRAAVVTTDNAGADNNNNDNITSPSMTGSNTVQDLIYGGPGNDTIDGRNDNDTLYGGSGNDTIIGGQGNDVLYGGSGSDTITGNANDDRIYGGVGADTLSGNAGADTFYYLTLADRGDTITDFTVGTDKIDVSTIDADGVAAGNQAFAWGNQTATAHGLWFGMEGADTYVYADTDGDKTTAEFWVKLTGTVALASDGSDFVL